MDETDIFWNIFEGFKLAEVCLLRHLLSEFQAVKSWARALSYCNLFLNHL